MKYHALNYSFVENQENNQKHLNNMRIKKLIILR